MPKIIVLTPHSGTPFWFNIEQMTTMQSYLGTEENYGLEVKALVRMADQSIHHVKESPIEILALIREAQPKQMETEKTIPFNLSISGFVGDEQKLAAELTKLLEGVTGDKSVKVEVTDQ